MTYQEGDTREPPSYRHHLQLFFKLALGPDASDRCLITNQVDGRRGTLLLAIAGLYVLGRHFFLVYSQRVKQKPNFFHAKCRDQKKLIDRKLRVCPECRG